MHETEHTRKAFAMTRTPAPSPGRAPHETGSHGSPQHPAPDRRDAMRLASAQQAIREKAYELYNARQGGPGSATEDWLRAEAGMEGMGGRPSNNR